MKNTSRKPYIYKVTNCENHQYYIGSQCSGKTIGLNYFTSSTNKEFSEGFKTHKEEKYKIEVIKAFTDPKECVRVENYIIRNYMQKRDGLCLNRFYCCKGEKIFSAVGLHHSEEAKQKISIAHKGIPCSEETRQKMSMAKKGIPRSEETRQKISIVKKGIPLSEEVRKKLSEAHKGIHLPEETRKKISIAQQGHPAPNRKKISISGNVFDSLTAASKYYNVSVASIIRWLKNKKHNAVYIEK